MQRCAFEVTGTLRAPRRGMRTIGDGIEGSYVLTRQVDEPVPALRERCATRAIPEALERVVMHALDKDPRVRFSRATTFRDALDAIPLEEAPLAQALAFDPDGETQQIQVRDDAHAVPSGDRER